MSGAELFGHYVDGTHYGHELEPIALNAIDLRANELYKLIRETTDEELVAKYRKELEFILND